MKEFTIEFVVEVLLILFMIAVLRTMIVDIKKKQTVSIAFIVTILLFFGVLTTFSRTIALSFVYTEVVGNTKGVHTRIRKGPNTLIKYEYYFKNQRYEDEISMPPYEVKTVNGTYTVRVSTMFYHVSWMDFSKPVNNEN